IPSTIARNGVNPWLPAARASVSTGRDRTVSPNAGLSRRVGPGPSDSSAQAARLAGSLDREQLRLSELGAPRGGGVRERDRAVLELHRVAERAVGGRRNPQAMP